MRRLLIAVLALFLLVIVALVGLLHVQASRRLAKADASREAARARAKDAAQVLPALAATALALEGASEEVGEGPGCQLRWLGEADERVKKHVARCGQQPGIPGPVEQKVLDLKNEALARAAEVPAFELPFEWMAGLRDRSDWRALKGTPYDFVDASTPFFAAEAPVPDCSRAVLLAKLRLIAADRAGALDEGTKDVVALAKALLGLPLPISCGFPVLRVVREQLVAAKRSDELLPPVATIDALIATRRAATQAWHPWVAPEVRKALLAAASPTARCVAAFNGLYYTDFGETLDARYPGLRAEFDAWAPGACQSPALTRAHQAPAPLEGWRRVHFSIFDDDPPLAGVVMRVPSQRAALLEDRLAEDEPAVFGPDGRVVR
jgi:hypothetical protein